MTLLEVMITLAVVGGLMFLVKTGFQRVRKTDLVSDTTELATVLRRASQLALERGELHRVVLDVEKGVYVVEVCEGTAAIARNEATTPDPAKQKDALERAKQRMGEIPPEAFTSGEPGAASLQAAALAGHHIQDRTCTLVQGGVSGDSGGKTWTRKLNVDRGVKFKEVWVQHQDEGATKGQVAIYFFPSGSAEKAVIELVDGDDTFSVLLFGLSGRIEIKDTALANPDDHMMKNAMGEHDKAREEPNP